MVKYSKPTRTKEKIMARNQDSNQNQNRSRGNNQGNFKNDPQRAAEAGRKGGERSRGGQNRSE